MPNNLSDIKKRETINAIVIFKRDHGYAPTVDELGAILGITKNAAWNRLGHLRDDGRVTWKPGSPRTLVVVFDQ